jgi:hypothetical protein
MKVQLVSQNNDQSSVHSLAYGYFRILHGDVYHSHPYFCLISWGYSSALELLYHGKSADLGIHGIC